MESYLSMSKSQILPSDTLQRLPDNVHFHVQPEDAGEFDEPRHEIRSFGIDILGILNVLFPPSVFDHGDAQNGGRTAGTADERVNENWPFDAFPSADVNEVQPALPRTDFQQRLTRSRVAVLVPGDVLMELHERAVHHFRPKLNLLVVVARTQKRFNRVHMVRDSHIQRTESVSGKSLVHIALHRRQVVQEPHEVLHPGDVLAGDGGCAQVQQLQRPPWLTKMSDSRQSRPHHHRREIVRHRHSTSIEPSTPR